jgi:serine/threonine-protein phosphatase 2A regulatory subunit B
VGDRSGSLNIIQRKLTKDGVVYEPYHRLQSHTSEFDYLKSVEIEAHINQICWLPKCNHTDMLLAANDKAIKLWRVVERRERNPSNGLLGGGAVATWNPSVRHGLRRAYANSHTYHINSVSVNCDCETFLSADDLRINLWHLDHPESQNVVDIKPSNMEDLTEVITAASFHPEQCAMFAYCTSKGVIKMGDLRESFTVHNHCRAFEIMEDPANRTFFSEIIGSLSDFKFNPDGRYILARDYLTLKIWDVTMESRPLKIIKLHEGLRPRLCELYENDSIFDKFECSWVGGGMQVMTGSYKNHVKLQTVVPPTNTANAPLPAMVTIEAARTKKKKAKIAAGPKALAASPRRAEETYESEDFGDKVLHVAAHPHEYEVAVAASGTVLVFRGSGE